MANKLFDTPEYQTAAQEASTIANNGYRAVIGYIFTKSAYKELVDLASALLMAAAGIYTVTIWENGSPTTLSYFTAAQGSADGNEASYRAAQAGQPAGTPIYVAFDCDLTDEQITAVMEYVVAFHAETKRNGYVDGTYGCGALCKAIKGAGYGNYTWLSGSTGYNGYEEWKPYANLIQETEDTSLFGLDVDTDVSPQGSAGGWMPAAAASS